MDIQNSNNKTDLQPFISGLIGYTLWGLLPLFWKMLNTVSADLVVCHRILWSCASLIVFLIAKRQLLCMLRKFKREIFRYSLAAIALTGNWTIYIWAVSNGYVLASSLGYFLAPILYIAAGILLFDEKLSTPALLATLACLLGLLNLAFSTDLMTLLIASGLAITIVGYGLLRKNGKLNAMEGLLLESILLLIPAIIWILLFHGQTFPADDSTTRILLLIAGPATLIPLIFYCDAVQKLPMSTIGFMQYISPILQFLIGVFFFHENLPLERMISFGLVWLGICIVCSEKLLIQIFPRTSPGKATL